MPSVTASVLGTPDPRVLARFHQRLLGWPIRDDTDQWATLRPPEPGAQRMQQDLDLLVDDEIVRVVRDPAGHPFCLFVRR
jgi:hypothetical protein